MDAYTQMAEVRIKPIPGFAEFSTRGIFFNGFHVAVLCEVANPLAMMLFEQFLDEDRQELEGEIEGLRAYGELPDIEMQEGDL